jgi:geranylgeranyl pyrophosphate synthase
VNPQPPAEFAPKPENLADALGLAAELDRLRQILRDWVTGCAPSMRTMLEWQFFQRSKYFRPLTIFACQRAASGEDIPDGLIHRAAVLEMMHNVSLIIDDILDHSPMRRGVATLHRQFGELQALMASGYIVAEGYRLSAERPYDIALFSELLQRLGVAECVQWESRRQPAGYDDWKALAQEDTGSMFEICAALATGDGSLRRFGRLLGMVYHGCDDVADVKGLESLGGGGEDDLRDGILTLPASLAIENDPEIRALFCTPQPSSDDLSRISLAMRAQIHSAEEKLDELAAEAKWEALHHATLPVGLYLLVDHTRELSRR